MAPCLLKRCEMTRSTLCLVVLCSVASASCGPTSHGRDADGGTNGLCKPGEVVACYDGPAGTQGVGPCSAGQRTCTAAGAWGACVGEVLPAPENCADGIDNNCNGAVDDDVDADGDGFTTCGGDCCDSTECGTPSLVNPGAFDVAGNALDDDCDGVVDNQPTVCDSALASSTSNAMDFAKALDLCQMSTMASRKWGVISAELTLADGAGTPAAKSHAIRPRYGTNVTPKAGASLVVLSTGAAASVGDSDPSFEDPQIGIGGGGLSAFPADFFAANGNKLPNAPGCPDPAGDTANDPVMLTLTIRVPTNAHSFSIDSSFFSSEFPEWTCSRYNDFFVILLDSAFAGSPPNPHDKNLAFYQPSGTTLKYPVGVNLAYGNTGLFTQCVNGATGCLSIIAGGEEGTITSCTDTHDLLGTGLDSADPDDCDASSLEGGGTGWLETKGNVTPGEIIKLRIAIWNTSDEALQSLAVIDNFKWSVHSSDTGTVILRR